MRITAATMNGLKVVIVAGAIAIVAARVATLGKPQASGPDGDRVPGPDHWIAFSADVAKTSPTGAVIGRFYQGADGSTRLESGPALGDVRAIDIKNIARERQYVFFNGKWVEHPMKLSVPRTLRVRTYGPHVTAAFVRTKHEGLDALLHSFPDGRSEKIIPELNFFVADNVAPTGERILFTNIKVAAVDDAVFAPPADANITVSALVGGIIEHGPDEVDVSPDGTVHWKKK